MANTNGTLCIAAYTHTSHKPNELQFEKGDVLTLIDEPSGDYCQATAADGSVGLIPMSSILERPGVMLQPMPWFHGPITRFEAEKVLDRNQDGQFLMRTSQSTEGIYALAVSHEGAVNHYLIAMDFSTRKLTISGKRYFSTLLELVNYYMKNGEDLGTCLRVPRIRRGALEYYVDTETLKQKWGLSEAHLSHGATIGKGEFGEVLTGTYRDMQVAVKRIHDEKRSGVAVTALLREAAVMTHMHHKNLVQLVGLVFKGSTLKSIVMEVMGKGSLQKYLISRGRSVVSQAELLGFSRGVCAGMSYISSQRFVHRDLAARNVLLNSNGQAKISDFGMAQRTDIHVPHEGGKFPIKWTAPEALKDSKFSSKSDVWSFGVFLWEVFSYGRVPYPSIPVDEVLEQIEDGYIMDPPDNCPPGIYEIMKGCWQIEPKERPSFAVLEQLLAKNFGETLTPHASPLPLRKMMTLPQIDQLLLSPAAEQAYRDAPLSRKANMFISNLTFLGPLGAGKTSLLRNIQGKSFRLTEPHTLSIDFSDTHFTLSDHLDWSPSSAALVYEEELVRIIIDDLLKHVKSLATASRSQRRAATPGAGSDDSGAGFGFETVDGMGMGVGDVPPPLPPVNRRRSHSFTDKFRSPELESVKATNRLSGSFEVLESDTPEGKLQLGYRSDLDARRETTPEGHRHGSSSSGSGGHRKGFMSRLFTGKGRGGKSALRRHHSDSIRSTHLTGIQPPPSSSSSSTSNINGAVAVPPPPVKVSSIPERLLEKIRVGMRDCTNSTLPVQFFSRFIDVPGAKAFRTARSLFVTDYSLCVLVYDTSKSLDTRMSPRVHRKTSLPLIRAEAASRISNGGGSPDDCLEESHFEQIMADFNNLGLHWSHSDADMTLRGQRVILVATHSDKVPSTISHANFDQLRTAIKSSPYHKYVAMMKYVLSSSSVIERSNMEDLKRYIIEVTKKSCRQHVPLKWLRCIRRFLSLSERGIHFIMLEDAKKIVSDTCDVPNREEVDGVVRFLHNNQVILHFSRIHQLCNLVFTSPVWFAQRLSEVFGAAWVEVSSGATSRLQSDQNRLQMRGILSAPLLEHVWKGETSANRRRLLAVLHKMDLVCCLGPNGHPISPSASPAAIAQEVGQGAAVGGDQHSHHQLAPGVTRASATDHVFSVSSLVVPSVVAEPMPLHLLQMPTFDLQPLHFRFKDGFVPYDVFPRLLTRCVHSYPINYTLYSNAGVFEVDESTLLLVSESKGQITVNLYQSRRSASTSPQGFAPVNLDEVARLPKPANLDTCMAVQMFLQAAISDIIQQWLPQVEYDLCVECKCSGKPAKDGQGEGDGEVGGHHMVLSQTDNILERASLNCEKGTQVMIGVSLYSWFGEIPHPHSPEENNTDYITTDDIEVVCVQLDAAWPVLGQALGFSRTELERIAMVSKTQVSAARKMMEDWKTLYKQNATFFALLGALEIIQRRDIADDLVAARMCGVGIDL